MQGMMAVPVLVATPAVAHTDHLKNEQSQCCMGLGRNDYPPPVALADTTRLAPVLAAVKVGTRPAGVPEWVVDAAVMTANILLWRRLAILR